MFVNFNIVSILSRKFLVLKNHYFYDVFIRQFLLSVLSVLALFFLPKFFVKILNLAYPEKQQKQLPTGGQRLKETSNIFDDFIVNISGIDKIDELNIVMYGNSFYKHEKSIDYSLPTFFINFLGKETDRMKSSSNIIGLTCDNRMYDIIKNRTNRPIILISHNKLEAGFQPHKGKSEIYNDAPLIAFCSPKNNLHNMQFGSGLTAIVALQSISNKINIYSWDNYLDTDIGEMSIIQYIYYLMSTPKTEQSLFYRRLKLMAEKVVNLVYAYRIISLDKFKIYSNLSGIEKRKDLYIKYKSFIYR